MITNRKELKSCLKHEMEIYSEYMFSNKLRYIISRLKREPARMIYSFLKISRKTDYYQYKVNKNKTIFNFIAYFYYVCKKNRLGEKLGFDLSTLNIKSGLMIYHYNIVINGNSKIGFNCRLHGNNCIGNDGKSNECPTIGDNVSIGVGAKVIGGITIANNIKIAAGAVVVHSFIEEGITIGGIPAKKIK